MPLVVVLLPPVPSSKKLVPLPPVANGDGNLRLVWLAPALVAELRMPFPRPMSALMVSARCLGVGGRAPPPRWCSMVNQDTMKQADRT